MRQREHVRAEPDDAVHDRVEHRLAAQRVVAQQETPSRRVPDRRAVPAFQFSEDAVAPTLESGGEEIDVRGDRRTEAERLCQSRTIEQEPVKHSHTRTIRGTEPLDCGAGVCVEDREWRRASGLGARGATAGVTQIDPRAPPRQLHARRSCQYLRHTT